MAKSSINFQKSSPHSLKHNLREDLPNYLLPKEYQGKNEYWKNEKSEEQIFKEELSKYTRRGKRPKLENSKWEAVVNLNKNHSLYDVKKLAKHIEDKFNITCTCIALHRDEGHLKKDKEGKEFAINNYHAHINFVTVKDQQQNWTLSKTKPKMRELQTEVANILKMERGKENSKAVRLDHRQYKAIKQAEDQKQELAKQKDLKAEVKDVREILTGAGAKRSDYGELEELVKEQREKIKEKDLTLQDLKKRMEAFKIDFENKKSDIESLAKQTQKIVDTSADEILAPAKKKTIMGKEYYDKDITKTALESFLRENRQVHQNNFKFISKLRSLGITSYKKLTELAKKTNVKKKLKEVHQKIVKKRAKSRNQAISRGF